MSWENPFGSIRRKAAKGKIKSIAAGQIGNNEWGLLGDLEEEREQGRKRVGPPPIVLIFLVLFIFIIFPRMIFGSIFIFGYYPV